MLSAARTGTFNYMSDAAQPSLYRNGRVLTRRDLDGSDSRWEGVDLKPFQMPATMRGSGPARTERRWPRMDSKCTCDRCRDAISTSWITDGRAQLLSALRRGGTRGERRALRRGLRSQCAFGSRQGQ